MLNADAVATVDDGPAVCQRIGPRAASGPAAFNGLASLARGAVPFAIFACPYERGCAWRSAAPERIGGARGWPPDTPGRAPAAWALLPGRLIAELGDGAACWCRA